MLYISTTIKQKYMDQILSGEKKYEYKELKEYWESRIDRMLKKFEETGDTDMRINFLCGRICYKFKIKSIEKFENVRINIDGVLCMGYYAIEIGERLDG